MHILHSGEAYVIERCLRPRAIDDTEAISGGRPMVCRTYYVTHGSKASRRIDADLRRIISIKKLLAAIIRRDSTQCLTEMRGEGRPLFYENLVRLPK